MEGYLIEKCHLTEDNFLDAQVLVTQSIQQDSIPSVIFTKQTYVPGRVISFRLIMTKPCVNKSFTGRTFVCICGKCNPDQNSQNVQFDLRSELSEIVRFFFYFGGFGSAFTY